MTGYAAFSAEYISGETATDNDENSEVLWLDIDEVISKV